MSPKTFTAMIAIGVAASFSVGADTTEDFIEREKTLEALDYDVRKLERDLRKAELLHKIQTVGQEEEAKPGGQRGNATVEIQDYAIPREAPSRESKEEEPSFEEMAARHRDRILDGAFVTAVFGQSADEMTAEIYLRSEGVVEVVKGESLGNWKITNVSLRSVEAKHINNGETRRITNRASN